MKTIKLSKKTCLKWLPLAITVLLFLLHGTQAYAQVNDNYANAIDITGIINSCSANAAYTTVGGTADRSAGSNWNNSGPKHNVWFKFTAPASGQINLIVDIGGVKGTLSATQVALWQTNGTTEVTSKRYGFVGEDVIIGAVNLTPGIVYYVSVDTYSSAYWGTFTLCLQDSVDYDFYEGAIDITALINTCSADAQYTTLGASADRIAGANWNNSGPKVNRWFKFTAPASGQINITVDIGGAKGSQSATQIALWQANGSTEVASKRYGFVAEDLILGAINLTPGATYYVSVDAYNSNYWGTFTLCLQDRIDYDFYEGAIDITGLMNSCSADAAYSTISGTPDKNAGTNWNNSGPKNNRWFKFTAPATGQINITVDIGGTKGSQSATQIALWQADGSTEVSSKRYGFVAEDLIIGAVNLIPGATYYVSVDAYNSNYWGTFTLCLQDRVDYDFYEGAIDITSIMNSCSADAAYSTISGTPDKNAGANWNNSGPKNNRWFKFTAPATGQINITINIGVTKGTQSATQIALWQANGTTEVTSKRYSYVSEDVILGAINLTPGATYYVSVDAYNSSYWGTFTLCLQDRVDYDFYEGAIDVTGIINSCSANAIYSTISGSADRAAGSNWNNGGPKFNRWFKFTAPATGEANITISIGGAFGTQSTTQVAVWQADGSTEIKSNRYVSVGDDVVAGVLGLTPGATYYISVDAYSSAYCGSFTICLKDRVDYDYYEGAVDVTGIINSCSADAAYTTKGATADKFKGSAWNGGPLYNRWFKFTAPATGQASVTVKIGGSFGSQQYSQVAIWQANGTTEVRSNRYVSINDNIVVGTPGLTPGATYYISVDAYSGNYGTFTLCIQDRVDYDYYEGAIDVTGIMNSCSADAAYTTKGATSDKLKGSTWNNAGPLYNRWFKFTAPATGQVNIGVNIGGSFGTQQYSQVAIWQADGSTEVRSNRYISLNDNIVVGATNLTPGLTYYISVDAYSGYYGTFTLCLQDVVDYDYWEGAIDVTGFINNCSPDAQYTTRSATIDKIKGTAWNGGPLYNRWFKFTAPATGQINVGIDIGGTKGTQQYSQVAIWQANGTTEISSSRYVSINDDVFTSATGLTPGAIYYISVDALSGYYGTFTLCMQDVVGSISGTATQCPLRTNQIFSIPVIPNATTYTWAVPTGWAITGGAGTTSITVTAGNAGQNGNISVAIGYAFGSTSTSLYAVTVSAIPTVTGSTPGSRCGPGTVNLSATASAGTLNWYAAATGGSSLATGTAFTTPSISASTLYYVDASNGFCTTGTRTAVQATINDIPTITATTPGSRCGTGAVSISATPSAGTVKWYSVAIGGTSLSSSTTYTTPSISSNTTYYVEALSSGCTSSSRWGVLATVNAIPTVTGTTPASRCGTGTVALAASVSAGTANWYSASTGGTLLGSGTSFTTPSISANTTYFVEASSNGCTTASRTSVLATVNALPTISGTLSACLGATTQLTGSATAAASGPWVSGTPSVATVSNTGLVTSLAAGTTIITYKNTIGCTNTATVTINPLTVGGGVTGGGAVCSSGNSGTLTLSGQTGTVIRWEFSINGGSTWTTIANTTTTQNYLNITQATQYRAVVQSGSCAIVNSTAASLTMTTAPSATISYAGTPFCNNSGTAAVTISGTSGGAYSASPVGASINAGTGLVNLALSNPGIYTIVYTVAASGGCPVYNSNTQITVSPNTWIGVVNSSWEIAGNWAGNAIPTSGCPNLRIPASTPNQPVISSGTVQVQNLTVDPGAILTVTDATLQLSGTLNSSNGLNATNATIEMNGTSTQTIPPNAFVNNAVKSLVINNSSTTGVTLNGSVDIYNSLNYLGTGKVLVTNDFLTLKSGASATARVGDMTGNSITGKVTVERYLSARKGWRFLSVPTNTTQTINQSWQEGCGTNANCLSGFGIQITGSGGAAAGFDVATSTPSMKTYNPVTGNWVGVPNTNTTAINNSAGYLVFVRGDRSIITSSAPAIPTILRTKGTLFVGDQPPIIIGASKFSSMGNPYASALDMRNITKTGIKDFFYVWDPQLAGTFGFGAYQTFSNNGSGSYVVTPGGGSYGSFGSVSNYLQSGQAVFVQATPSGGNVIFKEDAKSVGFDLVSRDSATPLPQLRTRLYGVITDSSTYVADGVLVNYGDDFSNEVDDMDALKYNNTSENLSVKTSNTLLVVERRHTITNQDTLFFNLANLKAQRYRFELNAEQLAQPGLTAVLIDNYLQNTWPLNIDGSTIIDFSIVNIPGSYASNRFMVVFSQAVVLPVTFTTIKASQQGTGIDVTWKVENEISVRQYEVEKSADGIRFNTMAVNTATGNNGSSQRYSSRDTKPLDGYNYYRIKSVDYDRKTSYSEIVKLKFGNNHMRDISIYPNPVIGANINLQLINEPEGIYKIRMMNQMGQTISLQTVTHSGGSSTENIQLNSNLPAGLYNIEIISPDNKITVIKIIK